MTSTTPRRGRRNLRGTRWLPMVLLAALAAGCASTPDVTVTETVTLPANTASDGSPAAATPLPTAPLAPSGGAVSSTAATVATPRIFAKPQFGSTDLAPTQEVTVTVFNATIAEIVVAGDDGSTLTGTLSDDNATWKLDERMNYGTSYQISGTATSLDGSTVPIKGELSTIEPDSTMRASFQLAQGGTYGVGTPIVLTFAGQVTDKAAAERALSVTTNSGKPIEGSWGWLQDEDIQGNGVKQSRVHYRTKSYWPTNTKVIVKANLYGVDLGDTWGREDLTRTFTIGRSQIVKADVNSFRLIVMVDGKIAKNYPVSYGRNTDPELETRSGTHIVQEKFDKFTMCNPKYGYCGFIANWAVRISNNGEFIHENKAVVADLGKRNVSHGCVNMSPQDAKDFYRTARYGDPVEVTGTKKKLGPSDGDIFDWTYDYETWQGFSAL